MAMSQLRLKGRADACTDQDLEGIVNKVLEELNELGDDLNDKWINIAKSLEIDIKQTADDEEHKSRKIIALLVKKSLGSHMWPRLLNAIEKEMPGSNVLNDLKEKYRVSKNIASANAATSGGIKTTATQVLRHFSGIALQLNFMFHVMVLIAFAILICRVGTLNEWRDPIEEELANNPVSADEWQEVGARTIRFLVTGKTGTGKSTLINALFGKKVAEEGHTLAMETKNVTEYSRLANGIPLIIWDSPGLQDGLKHEEEYMEDMVNKCKKLDLVLYTIRMDSQRIHEDDYVAMKKLTDAFGLEFWKKTMVVLTFANNIVDPTIIPGEIDFEKNKKYFDDCLKKWRNTMPEVFKNLNIPSDIFERIPIIPAGYYKVRDLPGHKHWFSNFWNTSLTRMKESGPNSHLLLHFSKDRFKSSHDSTKEDFEKDEQPIIVTTTLSDKVKSVAELVVSFFKHW